MTEEFNIFKNLEDLRKTNFLEQLKSLESVKTDDLNDSHGLDNDDFDFDSLVSNNNAKTSPTKRQQRTGKTVTPEKKSKKNATSRRSSTSSGRSISPTMPLLENLSQRVQEMPVGRRTRRSLGTLANVSETDKVLENCEPTPTIERGRGNGRGRRRGRGRGRGKDNTSLSVSDLNVNEESDNASSNLTIMEHFLQQGRSGRSRVMRAKRRYLAEIAARSTQVDYIDLVSSPMPRVEGYIELDSDTEQPTRVTRGKKKKQEKFTINSTKTKDSSLNYTNSLLDISFDEDNPELNIKINWKGKPEAFKLRKYQKFSIIFNKLAERENISVENIVFNLNDRIIMADDTPDSINYKIFHFIDGRVLSNQFNSPGSKTAAGKKRDANKMVLKIQSDKWKRPLQINIMKNDKFRILYIKCAEELKVGVDQLKLSFDGELLDLNDTPADLDLEGGEAIDLHIKK